MDRALLVETLARRGEPTYRADQVWRWAATGAAGYDAMTNLPASLRSTLAEAVPFTTLTLEREVESRDGTVKALFRTSDGHPVEAVLMRYRDGRRSLCLSSQSGCPLTCTFCATGQMRFARNLSASEIVDQALHFRRTERVDHAVFMGMGEPMLNLDAVLESARLLPDLGVTHRRTTISTVGWLPGLHRFVDEVEELGECLCLFDAVVDTREHHVFDEHLAPAELDVPAALGQHVGERIAIVDRHQLAAQLVRRRVERQREPDRLLDLVDEPVQAG